MELPFAAVTNSSPSAASAAESSARTGPGPKPSGAANGKQSFETTLRAVNKPRPAGSAEARDAHAREQADDDAPASPSSSESTEDQSEPRAAAGPEAQAEPSAQPPSKGSEGPDVNTQALVLAMAAVPQPVAAVLQSVTDQGMAADAGPDGGLLVQQANPSASGQVTEKQGEQAKFSEAVSVVPVADGQPAIPLNEYGPSSVPPSDAPGTPNQSATGVISDVTSGRTLTGSAGVDREMPAVSSQSGTQVPSAGPSRHQEEQPSQTKALGQDSGASVAGQGSVANQFSEQDSSLAGRNQHEHEQGRDGGGGLGDSGHSLRVVDPALHVSAQTAVTEGSRAASGSTSGPVAPTAQAVLTNSLEGVTGRPEAAAGHARSVVLEVAQPDLGQVNIRVAMTQDQVHAYLVSDRSEMGQYLLGSQDKLQAALQQAGLDLGQFRVDVQQQSAGRSFQHQTPQGQPQGGLNHGNGQGDGQSLDHERAQPRREGLLSLVA